jgi:hypothetical protein
MMEVFSTGRQPAPAAKANRFSLSRGYCCGRGEAVALTDRISGARRTIVDANGVFVKFPGIRLEAFWTKRMGEGSLAPEIAYRTDFERTADGRFLVLWCVQPDGRFWEDEDGFGGTSDDEIVLYSYLAENGGFTAPFRIYRAGADDFFPETGG